MKYREFGRAGWEVSDIGYGTWGIGAWPDSIDEESMRSLDRAIELGCNFFDTAFDYGRGRSERVLGELVRAHPDKKLYIASKIPPKNWKWPALPEYTLDETFPPDHIREYTEYSLHNLGMDSLDLMYLHNWTDEWTDDERWQKAVSDLKDQGLIRAFGISLNPQEPNNGLRAIRTGLIDAVQCVYNIFEQSPEDELFPLCREMNVALIARVPFDEGSLTGNLSLDSRWPEDDFRHHYFNPDYLKAVLDRIEKLRTVLPDGMTLPELALRFILSNPDVTSVIPGMRGKQHVDSNIANSDAGILGEDLLRELRKHRWDRESTFGGKVEG